MSNLSLSDWRTFLKARIDQEEGNDEQALKVFERLLALNPNNQHVVSSRAFALERLGRADEAIADRIAVKYADIGKTLIGPADKPDVWTRQLSGLLDDADSTERNNMVASALVAW